MKRLVQTLMNMLGYRIVPLSSKAAAEEIPSDMSEDEFVKMYQKTKPYTMTTRERMYVLHKAVQYIGGAGIPGDLVECGVWRGGSAMIMAYTLLELSQSDRTIYLYDTYAGMPEPSLIDTRRRGCLAEMEANPARRLQRMVLCAPR